MTAKKRAARLKQLALPLHLMLTLGRHALHSPSIVQEPAEEQLLGNDRGEAHRSLVTNEQPLLQQKHDQPQHTPANSAKE